MKVVEVVSRLGPGVNGFFFFLKGVGGEGRWYAYPAARNVSN